MYQVPTPSKAFFLVLVSLGPGIKEQNLAYAMHNNAMVPTTREAVLKNQV